MKGVTSKKVSLFFLIALGIFGVYFFIFRREAPKEPMEGDELISVTAPAPADAILGRELLTALGQLRDIKIDTSIFDDPVFQILSDFSVEIADQPVGRRNPFSPFELPSSPALPQ